MRLIALFAAATLLAGCAWETYQKPDGHTGLRQKYKTGTPVYYKDGSYSRNMQYNQYRPEQHAIKPEATSDDVKGTHWHGPASKCTDPKNC